MNEQAAQIAADVRRVFADVRPPPLGGYVMHVCPECAELEEALRGRAWQDLSFDILFTHRDALPLLSPPALRFYLPAFLLAVLERYADADTMTQSLLHTVERGSASFDEPQLKVLSAFGAYLRDHHGDDYPDDLPERFVARLSCGGNVVEQADAPDEVRDGKGNRGPRR